MLWWMTIMMMWCILIVTTCGEWEIRRCWSSSGWRHHSRFSPLVLKIPLNNVGMVVDLLYHKLTNKLKKNQFRLHTPMILRLHKCPIVNDDPYDKYVPQHWFVLCCRVIFGGFEYQCAMKNEVYLLHIATGQTCVCSPSAPFLDNIQYHHPGHFATDSYLDRSLCVHWMFYFCDKILEVGDTRPNLFCALYFYCNLGWYIGIVRQILWFKAVSVSLSNMVYHCWYYTIEESSFLINICRGHVVDIIYRFGCFNIAKSWCWNWAHFPPRWLLLHLMLYQWTNIDWFAQIDN